ncbi:hypothetical protein SBDP1_590014 [Syntrophobacter sp. SbD1]|nr:hypothetical protein SBDP1_590014 [Syntrophobacter sp. SbD1]
MINSADMLEAYSALNQTGNPVEGAGQTEERARRNFLPPISVRVLKTAISRTLTAEGAPLPPYTIDTHSAGTFPRNVVRQAVASVVQLSGGRGPLVQENKYLIRSCVQDVCNFHNLQSVT